MFNKITARKHRGILGPDMLSFKELVSELCLSAEELKLDHLLSRSTRKQLRSLMMAESAIMDIAFERLEALLHNMEERRVVTLVGLNPNPSHNLYSKLDPKIRPMVARLCKASRR